MSKILSFNEIIGADDLPFEIVDVPEWGGSVKVRAFTKSRQQKLRTEAMNPDGSLDSDKVEMLMFCYGVVEPEIPQDAFPQLREKNATVIDRILQAILRISGMAPDAVANAEAAFRR